MATKCAINGRQWGAYDGRRQSSIPLYCNNSGAARRSNVNVTPRGHGVGALSVYFDVSSFPENPKTSYHPNMVLMGSKHEK